MHVVMVAPTGKVAVVGVFFDLGSPNQALEKLWKHIPPYVHNYIMTERSINNENIDYDRLIPINTKSWKYIGSFTTPSCSRGVQWYLIQNRMSISKKQLQKYREYYTGTYRSIQKW